MKKKICGLLLVGLTCAALTACGKTETTSLIFTSDSSISESSASEEYVETKDTEEVPKTGNDNQTVDENKTTKDVTVEDMNEYLHQQFGNIDEDTVNFTIKMYMSPNETSFTDDDLYMVIAKNPEVTYSYLTGYLAAWYTDNKIYYYDENKQDWFVSEYTAEDEEDSVATLKEVGTATFPNDAKISTMTVNRVDYITVTYNDTPETEATYCFDDDYKLSMITSANDDNGFIFGVISLDDVVMPKEILNAQEGDYDAYVLDLYQKYNDQNQTSNSANKNTEDENTNKSESHVEE